MQLPGFQGILGYQDGLSSWNTEEVAEDRAFVPWLLTGYGGR